MSGTTATIDTSGSGGSGTVTSVTSTDAFINVATTTTTPVITIQDATTAQDGVLTSTDWNTFNNKGSGTITGSITDTQVAFGDTTADSIQGSSNFTFDGSNLYVSGYIKVGGGAAGITTTGATDLVLTTNTGTSSGSITITDGVDGGINVAPNGTGFVTLGNYKFDVDQTVGAGQDEYVLTYDHAAASISLAAGGGGGTVTSVTGTAPISSTGGATPAISLDNTTVTAASYTSADITVDAQGRITAAASGAANPAAANPTASVSGTATNGVATTFMRSDAAPALSNTAVTAASYTSADITVDAQGRITAASSGGGVTFPLEGSAGSATLPTYSFSGDTNTGIYRAGADQLNISLGGTQLFDFQKSGTSAKLQFRGGAPIIECDDASADLSLRSGGGTYGEILISNENSNIEIKPAGTGVVEISGAYKLPTAVTGANDYVLTAQTDGSTAWAAAGGGGTFSGSLADTQIAFGNTTADSIQGSSNLLFDGTTFKNIAGGIETSSLNIGKSLTASGVVIEGSTGFDGLLLRGNSSSGTITTGTGSSADLVLTPSASGKVKMSAVEFGGTWNMTDAVATVNDQVLVGQTDGTTGWAAAGISSAAPLSASATGKAGAIAYDSNYIYICTATDTWKRTAVSTWA